jgi:hypothetical protein
MIKKSIILSFMLLALVLSLTSYYLEYPWFIVTYTSCMAAVLTGFLFINPKD